MRTLDRYVIRETISPFLMALGVMTFLFAVRPMMEQAQELLAKGVTGGTVVYLLATLLPSALGITLPMAFLMGLLMAFGRLSADRESVAFLACGVSIWRLLRPALIMAAIVASADLWVMLDGIPRGNMAFLQTTMNLIAEKSASEIKPGQFYEGFPGKVLRVESVQPNGVWQRVILAMTRDNSAPTMVLADEGRLILNKDLGRAEIILTGVSRSMPAAEPGVYDRAENPGGIERYAIDPSEVYHRITIGPGLKEMSIPQLRQQIVETRKLGEGTAHIEVILHQKFSFPVACLVMGLLGVALGVHTRKDGKFASFALGLALLFVYYGLMVTFESLAKGGHFSGAWARWMPNVLLGPLAAAIIFWRSKDAERSFGLSLPQWLVVRFGPRADAPAGAAGRRPGDPPVLVIRLPVLHLPRPRLIDIYLLRKYVSVVAMSFVALLGLFYIGTLIDLSDKLFKGSATIGMIAELLYHGTPQYIYFLLPIAVLLGALVTIGAISKTGELTVLRSCGVSLYRLAVPLLLCAAVFAGVLFSLEEYVLADANKKRAQIEDIVRDRPTTVIDLTNRHWLSGTHNRIYYYSAYDARRRAFANLSIYELAPAPFHMARHTFVERAAMTRRGWSGGPGWAQTFPLSGTPTRDDFKSRALDLDSPAYFSTEEREAAAMTVSQLRAYVKTLKATGLSSGSAEVEYHRKMAMPLMTLVMTLIAVPFGVTTGKRGALYGIGLAIALAFAYQIAYIGFGFFGAAELLPPALAAWAPNLLFLAGAGYLLLKVRT